MASTQPSNAPKKPPFVAEFANCETHGEYPLNVEQDGSTAWYPPICPKCANQSRVSRLLQEGQIPPRFMACTFENYVASSPTQRAVLKSCHDYAAAFPKVGNLLLCGKPGTGKNHLATAILKTVLLRGKTGLSVKASQFLDEYWGKDFRDRDAWLRRLAGVDLLLVDEIGRSSNAKAAQDAFFRLFDLRYEAALPSIVTTNLNRDDLVAELGAATYDRLRHNSDRLTLGWDSYRAPAE